MSPKLIVEMWEKIISFNLNLTHLNFFMEIFVQIKLLENFLMNNLKPENCIANRHEISLKWVEDRLKSGCNCSDLMNLNLGVSHIVCSP